MIQTLFVIAHHNAKYAHHLLHDGSSSVTRCVEFMSQISKDIARKVLIKIKDGDKELKASVEEFDEVIHIRDDIQSLIECIHTESIKFIDKEGGQDAIIWLDNMLHYKDLFYSIFELHTKYRAHYSFADGFPIGISPEIFSHKGIEMLGAILTTEQSTRFSEKISRDSIFKTVELRINDFDIETLLSEKDLRDLRLSFTCDTRRNFLISKQLIEKGLKDPNEIYVYYEKYPEKFRATPTYIYVQLSSKIYPSSYTPEDNNLHLFSSDSALLSVNDWEDWIKKFYVFSPEAVLCVGHNGEVFSHPQFGEILEVATQYFEHIYVETKGFGWHAHSDTQWWQSSWMHSVKWIVYTDAVSKDLYSQIHNRDMKEVLDFINFLGQRVDKNNVYIQSVRMQENEEELESFMKKWSAEGYNPIIQKYNDYCGRLEHKKVIDISPIKRNPCFHLARDLVVLLDGRIVMCAQSYTEEHVVGNVRDDDIELVWEHIGELYSDHTKENYLNLCRSCDEFYTVNE